MEKNTLKGIEDFDFLFVLLPYINGLSSKENSTPKTEAKML